MSAWAGPAAIDGTTRRRSQDLLRREILALAWATTQSLTVGPVAVESKSHDSSAIPPLRAWLTIPFLAVDLLAASGVCTLSDAVFPHKWNSFVSYYPLDRV